MKKSLAFILLFFAAAGRGADALRPPAGETRETSGGTAVELGFGSVTFPSPEEPGPAADARPGERLACNRGTFSLRYELARGKDGVSVRTVSVRVRNQAEFFKGPHPQLEEHEKGHQRINEAGAPRIQKTLAAFSRPGPDLRAAERGLKARFRKELDALEVLHKDWDATSVFVAGKDAAPDEEVNRPAASSPVPREALRQGPSKPVRPADLP